MKKFLVVFFSLCTLISCRQRSDANFHQQKKPHQNDQATNGSSAGYQYYTGAQRTSGSSKDGTLKNSAFQNPEIDTDDESFSLVTESNSFYLGKDDSPDQDNGPSQNDGPSQKGGDDDQQTPPPSDDSSEDGDDNADGGKGSDDDDSTPPQTDEPETTDCPASEMQVRRLCSTKATGARGKWRVHWGANLKDHADTYIIRVQKEDGYVVKTFDDRDTLKQAAEQIFFDGKLSLQLSDLDPGTYNLMLCDADSLDRCKPANGKKIGSGVIKVAAASKTEQCPQIEAGVPTILVGRAKPGRVWNKKIPCDKTASPLILDLNGDGILLSSQEDGVWFDVDNDGFKDQISWPQDTDDGFLVIDNNNNGTIDNGGELFGNFSNIGTGRHANGFAALKTLDSNRDGKIDAYDQRFAHIKVWRDRNRNGASEASELSDLSTNNIRFIDLNFIDGLEIDQYANESRQRSVFERNGRFHQIVDVWFYQIRSR